MFALDLTTQSEVEETQCFRRFRNTASWRFTPQTENNLLEETFVFKAKRFLAPWKRLLPEGKVE